MIRDTNEQWEADMRAAGHDPHMKDGVIDMETFEDDPHYGPVCKKCGLGLCQYCHGSKPIPECDASGDPA